jgi:hypothetical protein
MATPDTTTPTNSGPRTAKQALLVPLAVLGVMVVSIGLIATLLLFNTNTGALALATVAAGGVLFAVSLLASRDDLDTRTSFVVVGAGALPLVLGGLVAVGAIGGVAPEDRMINVEPLLVVPEDAPLIGAENATEFCFPEEPGSGPCEPGDAWEVVPSEESDTETLSFLFDNRDAGVVHNVVITELEGSPDDPSAGEPLATSDLVTGPVEDYYTDEELTWEDLPAEWYFFCEIHAEMNGVGVVDS